MTRRSGQKGNVVVKGDLFYGRFYEDVAGQQERVRRAVLIGPVSEMTKPEAKRKLKQMIADMGIDTPAHLERATATVQTFEQKADWWESNVSSLHKGSSQDSSRYILKKYLKPRFGAFPIDMVTEERVQEWIADLQSGRIKSCRGKQLAPKTIHNMWKVLKLVIGKPSRDWEIRLPEVSDEEQRYFTPEEVSKIIAEADGFYKVFFHTAFATGARAGELLGLRVEDIDFKHNVIHIRRSTWHSQDTTPKTKAGLRKIDVDQTTIDLLKLHVGDRVAGRIFQTRNGTALRNGNIVKQVLKPICKKVGIRPGGMHAFRHGRVSVLQQSGVPGDLIKSWVGHTSLKTTSIYTHFPADFRQDLVGKLAKSSQMVPRN